MIYLIGSLRNCNIPFVSRALRDAGYSVFDDWMAAGPEADDYWQRYEIERGRTFNEALDGIAAEHVFDHDKSWLNYCDTGVLVAPAGRSAHLELGWMLGQGKRGYVLFDAQPERYDVMYKLATGVAFSVEELVEKLRD